MLYAYAAIDSDSPYANFTPSVAADVAPLAEMAREMGVPIAGKDGKTGQTFLKTVIAPALKERSLHVDGWFSTNILGNSDGLALDDPKSLASKLGTKGSVLDDILGYKVEDHIIMIHYYRPRGDDKEAWDNIDMTGFLGQKMQLKLNFLCKDSILAAPLAIEIARCIDLAAQRGEGGVREELSLFFKLPQTAEWCGAGPWLRTSSRPCSTAGSPTARDDRARARPAPTPARAGRSEAHPLRRTRWQRRDTPVRSGLARVARRARTEDIALRVMAQALAATRLGDLDHAKLGELGIEGADRLGVLEPRDGRGCRRAGSRSGRAVEGTA